jgi:hypothetical protein
MEERTTNPARMPRKLAMVRLQLGGGQAAQDAGGDADHRVLLVAAGGEGVGQVGVGDRHPRLGHVGQRAQPVDQLVQLGRLLGRHLAGAHRGQRDAVGEEVLDEQEPARDQQDQHQRDLQGHQHGHEDHVQQAEQEHGPQHAGGQAGVGLEPRSGHQRVTPG